MMSGASVPVFVAVTLVMPSVMVMVSHWLYQLLPMADAASPPVAVTVPPSMRMSPHWVLLLLSQPLPVPMPAACCPPVAVTLAEPPMVMSPQTEAE